MNPDRPAPGLTDLGPQYADDDAFTARMRLHQSWYRACVLRDAMGAGPWATSTASYGNMLDEDAGATGGNFLTDEIHGQVRTRLRTGGGVERYRTLHNMLSSQPMCFNLFGPLAARPELATRLLSGLLPEEVGQVEQATIEFAPKPKGRYLGDGTSFDAHVVYRRRSDNSRAFLAIETKLTEPFSQKSYKLTDRPAYQRLTQAETGPWRSDAAGHVADLKWNQLWRNHMLAEAYVEDNDDNLSDYLAVVVHHPLDTNAIEAVEGYRALLTKPATLVNWDLRQIIDAWRPLVDGEDRAWIDAFDVRYLQVWLSEAWNE